MFIIIIIFVLIIASISDYKYRRIPNYTIVIILLIGILNSFLIKAYIPEIIGLVFPSSILFIMKLTRFKNIGFGDIKLISAIGLFYGYSQTTYILFSALILSILYFIYIKQKKKSVISSVPFAPFITAVILIWEATTRFII